jgi:hypothetical protein
MESEFLVQSLGLKFSSLVKIDNLPLLVESISLCMNNNLGSFFILRVVNIKAFSILNVAESINFIFEDLEPLGISAPYLHVLCIT